MGWVGGGEGSISTLDHKCEEIQERKRVARAMSFCAGCEWGGGVDGWMGGYSLLSRVQ